MVTFLAHLRFRQWRAIFYGDDSGLSSDEEAESVYEFLADYSNDKGCLALPETDEYDSDKCAISGLYTDRLVTLKFYPYEEE